MTFRRALRHMTTTGPQDSDTSLGLSTSALIVSGMRELTGISKSIAAQTFRPLEVYLFASAIYLIWNNRFHGDLRLDI